ncbi:zinc finger, CCHC-type containing protein [Tanacetum coccineum]|uniref:Zinc finger, CCHC-type containing protein n=1 Tax=Tanacetum coccineum TaxID=301880 RepID=A0ABQ5ESI0_9ASTR
MRGAFSPFRSSLGLGQNESVQNIVSHKLSLEPESENLEGDVDDDDACYDYAPTALEGDGDDDDADFDYASRAMEEEDAFLVDDVKVVYLLTTPMPELMKDSTVEAIRIRAKWENDNYICRGHILNDHFKRDCRSGNKKNANAGGSEKGSKDHSKTKVDAIAWWIDSGATTHFVKMVCYIPSPNVNSLNYGCHLGHVHYKRMLEMSKDELIQAIDENPDKCNKKYVITFIDDASRFFYVYLLHAKDEALDRFRNYKTEVELQQNDLQNGVAERKNKALKEMVNSMLSYLSLSEGFWGEAMAVVRLPDSKRKTLGEKGIDCIFVGYAEHSKAYRFYVIEPNDSVSINLIIESGDAIFDENRFSSIPRPKDIILNSDESQRDDHSDDVPSKIPKPRKGFRQKEWIDYFDTYAPVARITTIRLLLALAAIHNLVIHQMDVKTTFLNCDLDEEVYIKQLKGFVMPGNEHKVCKLVKSLYGLKQAPKQWHQKFDEFSMKDMREAGVILGIKIERENKGIVITQSYYIEKILKKFNHEDCSSVSTPMDLVEKLKPNTGKPVDQLEYFRAIGCLIYVMTSTRPDIAYAVGRLSRFTSNPSRHHWQVITRVFKYLKGTMNYGLSYVGYSSVLKAYSDASWINHVEHSSSTSGWVFSLEGGAISWASKK